MITYVALALSTLTNVAVGGSSVYNAYCLRTGKCLGMPAAQQDQAQGRHRKTDHGLAH